MSAKSERYKKMKKYERYCDLQYRGVPVMSTKALTKYLGVSKYYVQQRIDSSVFDEGIDFFMAEQREVIRRDGGVFGKNKVPVRVWTRPGVEKWDYGQTDLFEEPETESEEIAEEVQPELEDVCDISDDLERAPAKIQTGKRYVKEEDEIIKAAKSLGKSSREIGQFLGRTKDSIDGRCSTLGIVSKGGPQVRWTADLVNVVKTLSALGKMPKEIGAIIGCSDMAVRSVLYREKKKEE